MLYVVNYLKMDRQKVYKKGLDKLIDVSSLRGDTDLHNYLRTKSQTLPVDNVYVHKRCRADYTRDPEGDMRRATNKSKNTESGAKRLQSSLSSFDWIGDCFLCGKPAIIDAKRPDRQPVPKLTLIHFRESVLKQCEKCDDTWANNVKLRLYGCIDLVAAEARYHGKCYSDFFCNAKGGMAGRPKDAGMQLWFDSSCQARG